MKNVGGHETSFSLSLDSRRTTAILGITETGGIGSVFDADESGVECFLGVRGEGLEEAFCRTLLGQLNCRRILVTLAVSKVSPELLRGLMSEIASVGKELV